MMTIKTKKALNREHKYTMKSALLRYTTLLLLLLTMSCEQTNTTELLVETEAVEKANPIYGCPTVFINEHASPTVGASAALTNVTPDVITQNLIGGNTAGPLYQVTGEFAGSEQGVDSWLMKIGRKNSPDKLNWEEVLSEVISYKGTEKEIYRDTHWRVVLKPSPSAAESESASN
ncbi:MAG: hypothetical protein L3J39_06625 [Verrucomicrobiales bacterium]|nr:hypothetical protein [Verrucomicrobiales bacterium]